MLKKVMLIGLMTAAFFPALAADLPAAGNLVSPLMVGAPIPSVMVTTVTGEQVDLAEVVQKQPSILVFYRGGW